MPENPADEALKKRIRELEQSERKLKKDIASLQESEARYRLKLDSIFLPEDRVGMLQLSDIIDSNLLQSMMDNFYEITHIGIGIIDLEGKVLIATGWQDICTRFHRVHPETRLNCMESDITLSDGVEPGTFRLYRCKNNMWDIATPITVGGQHLANLFLGQFIFSDETPDMDFFRFQARRYGFNEEEYLSALERVPRWSRETVNTVMTFYTKLAHLISELSFSNINLSHTLMERDNLLNSLLESEKNLSITLNSIGDAVMATDKAGNIVRMNPLAEKLTGWSQLDAKGRPLETVFRIIQETTHKPVVSPVEKVLKQGMIVNLSDNTLLISKDGKEIPVADSCAPIINDDGKVIGGVLVFRDQTADRAAQKALEESREKYRCFVEKANEGILAIDANYRISFVNRRLTEMLGYTTEEVMGKLIESFIFEADLIDHRKKMEERSRGGDGAYERRFRRKDGREVWTLVSATAMVDAAGRFAGSHSLLTDMTERKRAEKSVIRLSRLYAVLSRINEAIMRIRQPEELFLQVCRIAVEEGGLKMAWIGLVDPETFLVKTAACWGADDGYLEGVTLSAADGPEGQGPTGIAIRKGVYQLCSDWQQDLKKHPWLEMGIARGYRSSIAFPVKMDEQIIGTMNLYAEEPNFFTDEEIRLLKQLSENISYALTFMEQDKQRRLMEEALRESEQRYRTILQIAMDGFCITDLEGNLLEANDSYCRMTGYSKEELLRMRVSDIEVIESSEKTIQHIAKIMTKGEDRFETRHRCKDGRILDLEVSVQFIPEEGGRMIAFMHDITEMKRQEEDIRLRSLVLDQIQDLVTITNLDGIISYVNQAQVKSLGLSEVELIGKSTSVYGENPQQGATQREILEKTLSDGSWRGQVVNFTTDGIERFMDCRTQVIYDSQGLPKALCGIATDITDYKQSEKALVESEQRFRLLVKNSSDIITAVNPDGTQRYVSQAVERITGYRPDEVVGKHIGEVIHPDDMADVMKVWNEALAHPDEIHKVQYRHIHRMKEWVYLEAVGQSFIDEPAIKAVVVSVRDITARKQAAMEKAKLEVQLLHAQKMEAIGSLAGGIAHDLNNILFPISGLSEMLLEDFPPGSPEGESLEQIHNSAQRGSDLVKQILAFSRQSNLQKLPIRIQPIFKEVLKLSRATIPQNIEISSDVISNCGMISADPTQMHQILMNLITNAYHAVEQTGGTIHVSLRERTFTKNEWHDNLIKPGRYAAISVSDTGIGMDRLLIDRIFEPYFTTKKQGKGTGLGLSVVHGIIKEYGGDIRVYSEAGKGTTFHVYLPLLEDAYEKNEAAISGNHPKGHERILWVDDEAPIAQMIQKVLEKLGYHVTVRTSSIEALEIFKSDPLKFDLVISDRGMPKMTGLQLAGELIAIRPEIPIIICTGFTHEDDEYRAKAMGIKGFLMKPVAIADMAIMVRNVLDGLVS